MAATVSDVLAERATAGQAPGPLVALLSLAAHALFFGILIFMARPKPLPKLPFTSLPVRVVSPASLERPGASAASAAPPAPSAAPAAKRPAIEKPAEKAPPSEKALPLPTAKKSKETPSPKVKDGKAQAAPSQKSGPALELPAAGSGGGETGGAQGFGAAISFFDAEFPFSYYVEQLQSLIGANWLKPSVPDGTTAVIAFRILRSGQLTDVRIEAPSGTSVYDRAASRAVYAANPLPPLPPEYHGEALGVHIRFQ
jgi:TonB family protein